MNILITGGTGFIGSQVVRRLHKRGHKIYVISRFPSKRKKSDRISYINYSQEGLREIYGRGIDVTLHLATNYGRGNADAENLYSTNVQLPKIVLEEAVRAGSNYFINTDSYYTKNRLDFPQLDGYIKTKNIFQKILEDEKKIFGIKVILHHVYGRGDGYDKLLPSVIRSLSHVDQYSMQSLCTQKIDIICVQKVAEAFVRIVENVDCIQRNSIKTIEIGEGSSNQLSVILNFIRNVIKKYRNEVPEIIFKESCLYPTLLGRTYMADTKNLESLGWKRSSDVFSTLARFVENELRLNSSNTNF